MAGLFFAYINYREAKVTGRTQNVIVVILVVILGTFALWGLFNINPSLHRPFWPYGWEPVVGTVGLIIVSFTGFEKISTLAEELKRPGRNLPLSIVGSVIVATALYALVVFVVTGVVSYEVINRIDGPLANAASTFMGLWGGVGLAFALLLVTASSANAAIMASSCINFAMRRDGIMPRWFDEIHPRYRTPYRLILLTSGLGLLMALTGRAEALAEISSAFLMVSYTFLSLSCLVIRRAKPVWYKPAYRIPLYPWLPVVGGTLCLLVITTMERALQFAGLVLVLSGVAWYYAWARDRTKVEGVLGPLLRQERIRAHAAEMSLTGGREILVLVASQKRPRVWLPSPLPSPEGREKERG